MKSHFIIDFLHNCFEKLHSKKRTIKIISIIFIALDPKIWHSENLMFDCDYLALKNVLHVVGNLIRRIIYSIVFATFFYVKLSQSSIRISECQLFGSNATKSYLDFTLVLQDLAKLCFTC